MEKRGQQVANRLLSRIVDGVYGREGRLPSERDLALEMEISRPSVREALQTLEQWSVVTIKPGSGAAVRPAREWQLDVLRCTPVEGAGPWKDCDGMVHELLHLRRTLYRDIAARLCETGVSAYALQRATVAVEKARSCAGDAAVFGWMELDVMRVLLEAAGMFPSVWMLNQLASVYGPLLQGRELQAETLSLFHSTHTAFLEAIVSGDADRAASVLDQYLGEMEEVLYVEAA